MLIGLMVFDMTQTRVRKAVPDPILRGSILSLIIIFVALISFEAQAEYREPHDPLYVLDKCEHHAWPDAFHLLGDVPLVSYSGDVICLVNAITKEWAEEAISTIKSNNISSILISSGGGDVEAALKLATAIHRKNLDIYVNRLCISSCANYLFLAAREKFILDNSVVAWHGVPAEGLGDLPIHKEIRSRHVDFFRAMGMTDDIASRTPCDLRDDEQFVKAYTAGERPSWTYPEKILKDEFGLQGLHVLLSPESHPNIRSIPGLESVFVSSGHC